jgi:hypothetical protein
MCLPQNNKTIKQQLKQQIKPNLKLHLRDKNEVTENTKLTKTLNNYEKALSH